MNWNHFDKAIKHSRRIFIFGPPGVGKSYAALAALGANVMQVTLNSDTVVQELLGHYVPRGGEFIWHDGPISKAFREGLPLVVNEIGRASGAVQDLMLAVLDDIQTAAITLPTGETIRPANGFRVIATANTGPDALDEALHDRFDAVVRVSEPHPNLIEFLDQKLQGLGTAIKKSYLDVPRAVSPRRALAFLSLWTGGLSPEDASSLAFGDRGKDILLALKVQGVIEPK